MLHCIIVWGASILKKATIEAMVRVTTTISAFPCLPQRTPGIVVKTKAVKDHSNMLVCAAAT